jgi:hypothetical protein
MFMIPLHQENVDIVGVANEPLPHLVQMAIKEKIRKEFDAEKSPLKEVLCELFYG